MLLTAVGTIVLVGINSVGEGDGVWVAVIVGVAEGDVLGVACGVIDKVTVGVADARIIVGDGVVVAVGRMVAVGVRVSRGVAEGVADSLT
jgi:hypothetical protein